MVGPTSATVATAAAAQCDPRLRVIAIQAALSPFLQSADDLGLGPTIVASVEASPAMRAVAAQTQEAEPLASLEALLEYIPDAIATGVKADMLLAHCTQTRHTVATEGNPQSDPLHKWCRQLGALWEAANQALNLQLASRLEGDPNDFPQATELGFRERGTDTWFPVYDPEFPGPQLTDDDDDGPFGPATMGILRRPPTFQEGFRALTMSEVLQGLGFRRAHEQPSSTRRGRRAHRAPSVHDGRSTGVSMVGGSQRHHPSTSPAGQTGQGPRVRGHPPERVAANRTRKRTTRSLRRASNWIGGR